MVFFESVDYDDPRAVAMREVMDVEMTARYEIDLLPAEEREAVGRVLSVDSRTIMLTILALTDDGTPVAHAALRDHDGEFEVKRVIVDRSVRGEGVGTALMEELIHFAVVAGAKRLILQAGDRQPEAIAMYTRIGFTPIEPYEPYASVMPTAVYYELPLS